MRVNSRIDTYKFIDLSESSDENDEENEMHQNDENEIYFNKRESFSTTGNN
jgi:hypothetical protein